MAIILLVAAGLILAGLGITFWVPDVTHCKHLGADCYSYGSVLAFLVYHVMEGSPESNMELLWEDIKE